MERTAFVGACGAVRGAVRSTFVRHDGLRPLKPHAPSGRSRAPRWLASATSTPPAPQKRQRKQKEESPYSSSVNLPQTAFSQRAESTKREPDLQAFWARERIYESLSRENIGEKFILHDGPPFANGPLHCGHALNKVLKDVITRYQLMRGRKAAFVPGWDTHGLPIELKVLQGLKSKERRGLTPIQLRKKAREFAMATVRNHVEGMKRFGIWADWDEPYLTMAPEYEAAQIDVFAAMYQKGFVFRGRKPVHWSPSSRTALAEAELEYPEGHVSRSCYCAFPTTSVPDGVPEALRKAADALGGLALSIWTTTPWTLPANRAVAVNAELDYVLVEGLHPGAPERVVVVAKELVSTVAEKLGVEESAKVIAAVKGSDLVGIEYEHPLQDGLKCRVLEGGDYITTEAGTGLVHTAPGHGQEDYQTGLKAGLELASPVDDAGKFTSEAGNGQFVGMPVLGEGNEAVITELGNSNVLLLEEKYAHKYPYDWRTKKPTIFRATEQWFISLEGFRDDVLREIESVNWVPASGFKKIRNMVAARGDWCISRQRTWGVPIPVFYDDESGEALMTEEIVAHVRGIVAERGADAWWELEADELLPKSYRGRGLRKGRDTMDVWFDSGSSWAAVASQRKDLQYPADIYLEGSDQHRGWFQSSVLTSVAVKGQSPYKNVVTHGFVLDQNGVKMSKSIGNVVDPLTIIAGGNNKKLEPAYGADVLRLWVASVDYSADVMIGPDIVRNVSDVYRKLRNTLRYMLGNVHDFDPARDAVPYDQLPSLDRYMLSRLSALNREVGTAYESFAFYKVYQAMQRFAVVELSNFYLDIAKDRLYIPKPSAFRRRSCQTVLAKLLEDFARGLAPIIPHTAEDVWQNIPYAAESNNDAFPAAKSVFQAGWAAERPEWENVEKGAAKAWETALDARDAVNKVLEAARGGKLLGASMEAGVKIHARDADDAAALRALLGCPNDVDELKRAFIVSDVEFVDDPEVAAACGYSNAESQKESERFVIGVDRLTVPKCDRCWHYDETVGEDEGHPLICSRCVEAVTAMGFNVAREQEPAVL